MKKTNDSYCIVFRGEQIIERYYRDESGWLKVSNRGRVFRMTAEQVLNHLLPALEFGPETCVARRAGRSPARSASGVGVRAGLVIALVLVGERSGADIGRRGLLSSHRPGWRLRPVSHMLVRALVS